MPTLRLTLEYDGREFAGWQAQPRPLRTVQGALEEALARVTGERVRAEGSGRTDAGVHAEGQVASARLEGPVDPGRLREALNAVLPGDVAVIEVREATAGFHARYDARGKLYRYRVWNARQPSPLRASRALWVRQPLDVPAMRRAASDLLGAHDFAALQAAGSDVSCTVRTLRRVEVAGAGSPGELTFRVEGDGFLRQMVRVLVGTLLQVGRGARPDDGLPALLAAGERRRAGPTAPAHGLTLVRVYY